MNTVRYAKDITALLVIDPYNEFISEGGKSQTRCGPREADRWMATTLTWPETQQRVQALFKGGLQQEGDLENRFGAHLATLLDT
jgi:hypothetical protein